MSRNRRRIALVVALIPVLGSWIGCSTPEPAPDTPAPTVRETAPIETAAPSPLAGTAWRLVKIQSMDDRVYTPDERDKYTLTFEVDGRIAVRADCNRGTGNWTFEPPSDLTIGPLALTRVMCPPDSLHDRFVSDLDHSRSFVLEGGHLHLATMADGAILEFEPVPSAAGPSFDCAEAANTVQELICGDPELAGLDLALDDLYLRALEVFPAEELGTLKAMQRGWIKGRDDCWKSDDIRACVLSEYETRMTELQIRTGVQTVPEPVDYECGAGEGLTAVFYRDTTIPAAVLTRPAGDQVIAFLVPSGSGAKYEGRNVTFWEKGGEATLTWLDETRTCRAVP